MPLAGCRNIEDSSCLSMLRSIIFDTSIGKLAQLSGESWANAFGESTLRDEIAW
jgi:hypothetical protein